MRKIIPPWSRRTESEVEGKLYSITAPQNKVLSEAAADWQTLSSLQLFEPTGPAADDSQSPDHFVTQDASLKFFLLITSWSCRLRF
ncbi:hypothetical protein Q5P01_013956 [Channa striata]|uniref:Uncharacterized protein n=1 Tax=Channa striata TaxID=64152 RepID=A0AA88MLG1_CHASR|nr:hypothetical protein Q5P01_013956 [Channa striata]